MQSWVEVAIFISTTCRSHSNFQFDHIRLVPSPIQSDFKLHVLAPLVCSPLSFHFLIHCLHFTRRHSSPVHLHRTPAGTSASVRVCGCTVRHRHYSLPPTPPIYSIHSLIDIPFSFNSIQTQSRIWNWLSLGRFIAPLASSFTAPIPLAADLFIHFSLILVHILILHLPFPLPLHIAHYSLYR